MRRGGQGPGGRGEFRFRFVRLYKAAGYGIAEDEGELTWGDGVVS